jgi:hypothetical protein
MAGLSPEFPSMQGSILEVLHPRRWDMVGPEGKHMIKTMGHADENRIKRKRNKKKNAK